MRRRLGEVRLAPSFEMTSSLLRRSEHSRRNATASPSAPRTTIAFVIDHLSERTRKAARVLLEHCRLYAAELIIVAHGKIADPFGSPSLTGKSDVAVRLIDGPLTGGYRALREAAFLAATGDVITFIEDWRLTQAKVLDLITERSILAATNETGAIPGLLSVVVPAHDAGATLNAALVAILDSDLPRDQYEIIVVDDASGDDTAITAARAADRIIRLPRADAFGPAYARNRGAEFARGEYIAFVDADVCVHTDALTRFVSVFETDADVGAVLGSYDARAADPRLLSQYRNLLYHFYHQRSGGEARAFWAGCGAVRASVFAKTGMYDEWRFPRPQIEDIDLGHRIRDLGFRIKLCPEIQACHLRGWTLRELMATDFRDHAIPWMRVMSQRVPFTRSTAIGLRTLERIGTGLTWFALICLLLGWLVDLPTLYSIAIASLAGVAWQGWDRLAFFKRARGWRFAVAAFFLDSIYYLMNGAAVLLGWVLRETVGEPSPSPTIEAFAEVGVRTWPPIHAKYER